MRWGYKKFVVFAVIGALPLSCAGEPVTVSIGDPTPDQLNSSAEATVHQDLFDLTARVGREPVEPVPTTSAGSTGSEPSTKPKDGPTPKSQPVSTTTTAVVRGTAVSTTVPVSLDQQVLAFIDYPFAEALPGWRIEFTSGRAGYRGSTYPTERLIQIYVREDSTLSDLIHVTAHEIGHALDVTYLTDNERAVFAQARGRNVEYPWWTGDGMDDFSVGAGDFAETFAYSQYPDGAWNSRIGNRPTEEQIALMYELLAN